MKTDSDIQEAVLRELAWSSRVSATEVGVEVRRGIVTLTGNVDSLAKRLAAQEAAHRVAGVLDVANELRVVPLTVITDTDIAQAVRRTLEWDVFVPDRRIRSTVSGGVVTLEGDVDAVEQRDDAERAIRNLRGVRRVVNELRVRGARVVPEEVKRAITDALQRHAAREARAIAVDVDDGTVVLTGRVESAEERIAVIGAARGARGVRAIDDRLSVADARELATSR